MSEESKKIYVACWQHPGEKLEMALYATEGGAFDSLAEEIGDAINDDRFSFEPQEYDDILAGEELGYPTDDEEWFYVSVRIMDVLP